MISEGRSGGGAMLGLGTKSRRYLAEDINVNVGQDVVARRTGLQLADGTQAGGSYVLTNYNILKGSNDSSFNINGDVIVENDSNAGGDATYYGFFSSSRDVEGPGRYLNNRISVGGDVKVLSAKMMQIIWIYLW